jgi:hypothetical protein
MFYVEQFLMSLILFVFYFFKLECSSIPIFSAITKITKQNFICILLCLSGDFIYE